MDFSKILKEGSNISGWLKVMAFTFTLCGTAFVAYNQLIDVSQKTDINTSQIQMLREDAIRSESRVLVLEQDRTRQDAINEKMMTTLNSLNLSIERLNTTIDILQNKKGR